MNGLLLAGYIALFSADAATTHVALNQPQIHEQLLTQSAPANDALLAGQATALYWATAKIQRPWLRWTVRFGIAGIHGYAAAHNIGVIRSQR